MVKNKIKVPKRNKIPEQMSPLLKMAMEDYSHENPSLIKSEKNDKKKEKKKKRRQQK